MFTATDLEQIIERGSNLSEIQNQISHFKKGFPYLKTVEAAGIGSGIIRLTEDECKKMVAFYELQLGKGTLPLKFVPASGAASRMFQSLFSFQEEAKTNQDAESLLETQNTKVSGNSLTDCRVLRFILLWLRTSDHSVILAELSNTSKY